MYKINLIWPSVWRLLTGPVGAYCSKQSLIKSELWQYFLFILFILNLAWHCGQLNSVHFNVIAAQSIPSQKGLLRQTKSVPSSPYPAKRCTMPDRISSWRSVIYNPLVYSQIPRTVLDVSVLSDDDLIQNIRSWGGTPKALTENKDMMKIAVRVLRADLTLLHNYRYEESWGGGWGWKTPSHKISPLFMW